MATEVRPTADRPRNWLRVALRALLGLGLVLLLLAGILACLTYFFFSVEHKGGVGKIARVGIWYLMITFGAAFGFTVMGRIALLAARLEFLFNDWLWLIDPTDQRGVANAAAMVIGGV